MAKKKNDLTKTEEFKTMTPAIAEQAPVQENPEVMDLMMDVQKYDTCFRLAKIIASNKLMPKHLIGDEAVCFQVVTQSLQWGLNPFVVAQKTYAIGNKLSYEAQLVSALINKLAPIKSRLNFKHFGDWEEYINSGLQKKFESGIGVRVYATLKGENEPRVLEVRMNSIGIRNSSNWKNNPQQQICYVGTQRWARLYCPGVILGVYTPDELEQDNSASAKPPAMKNITPDMKSADKLKTLLKSPENEDKEAQANLEAQKPAPKAPTSQPLPQQTERQKEVVNNPSLISEKQRKMLFAVCKENNVSDYTMRSGLEQIFKVTSTKDLRKDQFENVLNWVRAGALLPSNNPDEEVF